MMALKKESGTKQPREEIDLFSVKGNSLSRNGG